MSRRLLTEIGKSQRITILETLKRRGPLSVRELSVLLRMSYMGIKQHCINLQKNGYLDTWRKPGAIGRPQMLYRLTHKAGELYERADNRLSLSLLEASKKLFGPTAAEKLLFQFFQVMAADYAKRLRGETPQERAQWFARLRDQEGYVAQFLSEEGKMQIVEHHNPYLELMDAYPVWERQETEMIQRLIGAPLRRTVEREAGMYRCILTIVVR
ncbi:MAG: hypothetical protein ABI615_12285 [Chthoniobacterales bacterium]